MFGDYESLSSGHMIDALVDFTGGISERLDLVQMGVDNDPFAGEEFMTSLTNAAESRALITAQIKVIMQDGNTRHIICDIKPRSSAWVRSFQLF